MKLSVFRALPVLLLLALFPASLSAISVFDVIRLTQEKYPDREIIKIIQLTDSRFVLKADDTSRLKKEGVSETVIREMLSRPAPAQDRAGVGSNPQSGQPAPRSSRSATVPKVSGKDAYAESRGNPPADYALPSREPAAILDEIVRLTKAGMGDETVLAYAKAHRADLPAVLPAERLNYLRDSGVSRNVILYLTAIDVRASGDAPSETTVYQSGETEPQTSTEPVPPQTYSNHGYADNETVSVDPGMYDAGYSGYSGYYGGGSYPLDYYYPATDYFSYYGGCYGYPYYGYPYYGYPCYYGSYYYPWPAYFFWDGYGHGHGHGHGHGGHGHDGHGGHGGHWGDHNGGSGGWGGGGGGTGTGGGGNVIAGQTWRDRPTMASNNFSQTSRQPRTLTNRGGQGTPSTLSRGFNGSTRGGVGGTRTVGPRGFSGGGSASAMSRAPIGRAGGRSTMVGRGFSGGGPVGRGFSGGGGGGRAPIARSGGSFGGGRSGGFSGGMARGGGGGGRGGGGRGR